MAKSKTTYEITKSRIIKFIVGKNKAEHNVHRAVISRLSKPLRALVTNGMRESVEVVVVWADVDSDAFALLMEFAYSKDFTITDEKKETRAERKYQGTLIRLGVASFTQIICDLMAFIWPNTLPNDQFRELIIDYLGIEFHRAFKLPCIFKVLEKTPEIYIEVLNRSPEVREELAECDRFMAMHPESRNRKPLYRKPSSSLKDLASARPEREKRQRLLRF
ncbi:hypothetical protein BDP55DRAFT_734298 [Colletotrichum godetiae]|uniref:BTB domain-containing protein n=1 Tax=Colletotrichum godetiae TaxID=1209918 RepID=A0AAJ0EP36_9PEZI|nr:uncharacterized protein BDP55DRAFT_734298 [Colletotrichum godetiae]KAK1658187.1 hypothetical protein BDP55DRAFT_734298 [Colletotrichum godetiae]